MVAYLLFATTKSPAEGGVFICHRLRRFSLTGEMIIHLITKAIANLC